MALEEDDECDGSESDEGEGRAGAFKQGDEADEINEVWVKKRSKLQFWPKLRFLAEITIFDQN